LLLASRLYKLISLERRDFAAATLKGP